jgi:hypothetical protein
MTVARKSHKASAAATATVAALVLCPMLASAHFTLMSPAPSREKQAYPSSNERFWPITGGGQLRPKLDCLQYPRGQVATAQPGQSLRLGFEIGNHASHVGLCTASLIDLGSGAVTDLGSESDCVSKQQAMDVKLPTKTCANCVATHLGAQSPEGYDSCVDVNIGGGSGGAGAGAGADAGAGAGTDKSQVDSSPSAAPTPTTGAEADEPETEPAGPTILPVAAPTTAPVPPAVPATPAAPAAPAAPEIPAVPAIPSVPAIPAAPAAPAAAPTTASDAPTRGYGEGRRRRPRRSHGRFTGTSAE